MPGQNSNINKESTLRLSSCPCKLVKNSKEHEFYNNELIYERHRHRYEVNNEYRKILTDNGLTISSTTVDERLVNVVEIASKSFHIGIQFHPEFKSCPNRPHPLFANFIIRFYY